MTAAAAAPPTQAPARTRTLFGPDTAGLMLARLTVAPVLAVVFFLLVAFPLLLIGWYRPVPVLVLTGLAVVIGVPLCLRHVRRPVRDTPWWAPAALVVIAIGFAAFQLHYRSAFVIVTRDPASYMQFANWIAHHGSLPIPENAGDFGSAKSIVQFDSFAYFQVGHVIVPQFMAGLPMMLAAAWWIGGVYYALSAAPLLGGLAVLTFGGLAARLVGPRWAVPATLTLAASFPEMFTSRSTYSEPVAQILLLGGLCLIIDSQRAGREARGADGAGEAGGGARSARVLAAMAGLALGVALLVRLDAASDTLPFLPWCGALLVARRPQAIPAFVGFVVGSLYGVIDGVVLTRPYLKVNISSVAPLALVMFVVMAGTLFAILGTNQGMRIPRPRWLPDAAAVVPFVVIAGATGRALIAPHRITLKDYGAHSIQWIFWWVGIPMVLVAMVGAALLSRRVLLGKSPEWVLPLIIFGWAIVEFLGHPAITPDQPWASRRLVPAVIPGCILLAAWACAWLTKRLKERGFAGAPSILFAACCGVALLVPPAWTAFKPHLGSHGVSMRGLAVQPTYHGELAAMDKLCAEIPSDASVVVTDGSLADRLLEDIRGMCDVPTARLRYVTPARVNEVLTGIEATGRRAVLLGRHEADLTAYPGGTVKQVMNLHTKLDAYDFGGVPRSTWSYQIIVWMWEQNR